MWFGTAELVTGQTSQRCRWVNWFLAVRSSVSLRRRELKTLEAARLSVSGSKKHWRHNVLCWVDGSAVVNKQRGAE